MNLRRCENGHFYDADKFSTCPHCSSQGNDTDVTMPFGRADGVMGRGDDSVTERFTESQDSVTEPLENSGMGSNMSLKDAVSIAMTEPAGRGNAFEDDEKTVSYYKNQIGIEPVVGWLVCIEGKDFGESYKLKTGRNFIGRGNDMDICLRGDASVSRNRHAIILYEPRKREFIAQAGESRELFYVNDDVVLLPLKLKKYDILSVGKTRLMFFPCCDEVFSWDDYRKED